MLGEPLVRFAPRFAVPAILIHFVRLAFMLDAIKRYSELVLEQLLISFDHILHGRIRPILADNNGRPD